jgi:RNA polymerase sigma factor (sigma-70 family)
VRAVKDGGRAAEQAVAELCSHYWYPIYAFIRRRGHSHEDAEDLTQGFFATLLADESLTRAEPERGRLRTFLLTVLQRFLADTHRRASREKRGGHAVHVPLDFHRAGERYAIEPPDHRDPETLYHLAWSRELLTTARRRLAESYAAAGKADQLNSIESHLEADDTAVPYRELSTRLGQSEPALRLLVFRARQKLRSLIETEITRTLSDPADAADEVRFLFAALAVR